jgi:polar amino acid transport system substrate-binding protein
MLPRLALIICTLLTAGSAASAQEVEQKIIRITGDDYCPLACNPESGHNGLGYDLAKLIYEPLGWKVEYRFLPWLRGLLYFQQGKLDLLPGVPKDDTPELRGAHFSTLPVIAPRMCFYTRADQAWTYRGTDSLLGGRLGIISGYYYWPELREYIAVHKDDGRVDVLTTDNAMDISILKLSKKRIDYFAELRPAVEYQLLRQGLQKDIREATCLESFPLYMAFRPGFKEADELNAQWDKQLMPLLQSPQGVALLNKYGLTMRSISEQ